MNVRYAAKTLFLLALLTAPPLFAAAPARPAAPANETVVVPDRFLRRWDAITIFLPADGAAADSSARPEQLVSIKPAHPGAYRWLDEKTIQFAPAEPWPPLARVVLQVSGKSFRLQTLLSPPTSTHPAAGSTGLEPIEEIALSFAEPISAEGLARAVSIEARPLPGVSTAGDSLILDRDDFEIKALDRAERGDAARYVLALRQPIPLGRKVLVRFRLSLDDAPERSFSEVSFSTAEPFRALRFGCRAQQLPALSAGARYSAEQALTCEDSDPTVVVDFSAVPAPIDTVAARNLVRLQPAVGNLQATLSGKRLELRGDFARETAYRVTLSPLAPTRLLDTAGRALDLAAVNELELSFPRAVAFLRLARPSGLVERDGPQMAPVSGRGDERIDLRIHRIDPLDRSFWPLREKPVEVDEGRRPPGPGEQPEPWTRPELDPNAQQIAERIAALGSPQVSALIDLPLRRDAGSANFGLDLAPHLKKIAGGDATGSYLIGLRRLGAGSTRSWMRIDVTDLALSTLEEARRTVFVVTSLSTAKPVAGAEVLLEGALFGDKPEWTSLFRGVTDGQGRATFDAPGAGRLAVRRLVVTQGNDRLILDPDTAPDGFADNRWQRTSERWLQWMFEPLEYRGASAERLAHVFTERPVYRPDEPVHIKAYLRVRTEGRLEPMHGPAILFVEGPGDLVWRYPVTPSTSGSVYWKFDEADLPTGSYRARFELAQGDEREVEGGVSFRKEAYRLPRFEVRLDAPERAPLDQPFDVRLTATYYAGGRVAARPIEWRVTQFPFDWRPATRPGFVFSSDARYSRDRAFESTPVLERADSTDEDGGAKLPLNPTLEPTAQPRTYVVEATVIDADDQTVSATRQIVALPALLLGLKVPRYLEDPRTLAPEVLVLGPDEKPRLGEPVTVRLKRRRWHSHLRASDFSDGVARYVTEVVDETLSETVIQSAAEPVRVPLGQSEPGVYIVEVEGRDRLGRTQAIAIDLFAGTAGDGSVSWPKPATAVFQVVPDRLRYKPGETAQLVLESPFQNGEALAVVEAPDGNRVSWLPVRGGRAVFEVAIEPEWTPRVPVHFLLLRGRIPKSSPVPGNATDLGRPATFGATSWLDVEPLGNRVTVELAHPSKAQPGQEVEVTIRLKKPNGEPTSGEVTLWLVDQAVMALGREQRLDPVPSFLTAVRTFLTARDSRALVFGFLPFASRPGGDEGEESKSLLDRQTIRKNFQPVPYYEPAIEVGPEGVVTVKVKLPDDLTNFLVRAKATASLTEGWKRFGYATGKIEVRQPVVVQPSLPRFVRPGDRFTATAVGRIVDGPGGAGKTEIRAEGLTLEGPAQQALEWVSNRATRIDFPVSVPLPRYRDDGTLERTEVVVRLGAERTADKAGDAVEVRLPLRDDRDRVLRRELVELEPGKAWNLPEPSEAAREGSLKRKLLLSNEPGLVTLSAGLDFLLTYPYACTEQRLATTRSYLALRRFRDLLHLEGNDKDIARAVADTLTWLPLVQQENGLFAYWPGGGGSVSLTSWASEFLVEAREAGYLTSGDVDGVAAVEAKALRALEQALRSDYSNFVDGEAWAERSWALKALARAGKFDVGYGNELARRAQFLDLENAAGVLLAFERAGKSSSEALPPLEAELWKGFATRLHQGHEMYGGLRDRQRTRSGLILPSETRTISEMTRALVSRADTPDETKKLAMLIDALVALGDGDGWGDTNANSSAILALAELLEKGRMPVDGAAVEATLTSAAGDTRFALDAKNPTGFWVSTKPGKATLTLAPGSGGTTEKTAARAETSYLPAAPGSQAAPRREGFVVSRELAIYRAGAGAAASSANAVPPEKLALEAAGQVVRLTVGDVVEDRVQVVNPEDRNYVAIVVPLAAGMEPLNPNLETAPPEAKPSKPLTLEPTYSAYLDDQVAFYFDTLPKGTYEFVFRTRAQVPGTYQQPPAKAERMYDQSVVGSGAGAVVEVKGKE